MFFYLDVSINLVGAVADKKWSTLSELLKKNSENLIFVASKKNRAHNLLLSRKNYKCSVVVVVRYELIIFTFNYVFYRQ